MLTSLSDSLRTVRKGDKGPHVKYIQLKLNKYKYNLLADGVFGKNTELAVMDFQQKHGLVADGICGDRTLAAMSKKSVPKSLTQKDLVLAAKDLGVEVEAIMAVSEVESMGKGFLNDGRPVILFERHWMLRRLHHYGINPKPYLPRYIDVVNGSPGGYKGLVGEHTRLNKAMKVHEESALESASWGRYQIMGFHWEDLGFLSIQEYVECMRKDENEQLKIFIQFIKNDDDLLSYLKRKDWTGFALKYNGPKQKGYDIKLGKVYNRIKALHSYRSHTSIL